MEKGLVSIVSPCYNREKLLFRLLDSILMQTYKKIQVILIDDGSTDKTKEVVDSYREKFKNAGIGFEYYYQKNGGVSSAINHGLKYVKGEFLCWPDSDDWYEPDAIRKRVDFLNKNLEYGIVSSDADIYYENSMNESKGLVSGRVKERLESNQFQIMLQGKSLVCPICHMVRTEAFFDTHPKGTIFDSRHGQNIQMLLPVYYKYKRGFIDEPLCHYLVLENSLSRSDDTFEKKLSYRNAIDELTTHTLNDIDMPEKEREQYLHYTKVKNTRRRLILASQYHKKEFAKEQISELYRLKSLKLKDIFIYFKC